MMSMLNMSSKTLSYLLRHGAIKEGFHIDSQGFVEIAEVIAWFKAKKHIEITHDELQHIVDTDNKTRFSISGTRIRANQGHSLSELDIQMTVYTGNGPLVHCSYQRHTKSIITNGLNRMSRQHIHMIDPMRRESWSLIRKNSDLYVVIDVNSARRDGIEFLVSDNGVVLSTGIDGVIPAKHLTQIIQMSQDLNI